MAVQKILVLSLDYDDCLVRRKKDKFDPIDFDDVVNQKNPPLDKDKWKEYLLNDNDPLINFIKSIAPEYDVIKVCSGSNRQNPSTDTTNSCRDDIYSGSCFEGLELFKEKLQQELGREVELNKTTTADYFYQRQEGDTFERTLSWLRGKKKGLDDLFQDCPNDRTKVSLHYRLMHMFAKANPKATIDYYAIDDSFQGEIKLPNPSIIDAINYAYSQHLYRIPKNTHLFTMPYQNGEIKKDCIQQMDGTGNIDLNYNKTMENLMIASLEDEDYGEDYTNKKAALFDHKSCDCWAVFDRTFVEEFIFRHQESRNSGFLGGFFNRTNINSYDSLSREDIFNHAKKSTFLGFKNRTRKILEEMDVLEEELDTGKLQGL